MTEQKSYKTDKFGSPDDRDYHYRIPLNDDHAMRLARWALHGMVHYQDRFVVDWDGYSGNSLSYMGIRTHDSKGHLKGLEEYSHSPKWKDGFSLSDIDEYRSGYSGGTKIKGSFRVDPQSFCGVSRLTFQTTIPQTPTELEAAQEERGDTWDDIQESIKWAKDDAMEQAREQIAEKQRNCNHEHSVFPDRHIGRGEGYCEDCGAELTEDRELAR